MNRKCLKRDERQGAMTANDKLQPNACIRPEQLKRGPIFPSSNHPINKSSNHPIPRPSRPAFTLVELLVTITIIGILAGMSLGAMHFLRNVAAEDKTKATIAKINAIVLEQYDSYMTRRLPIDFNTLTEDGKPLTPKRRSQLHCLALLDLMRMEMPERTYDILEEPLNINMPDLTTGTPKSWITRPPISQIYYQKLTKPSPAIVDNCRPAKYLYLWISLIKPEFMEHFNQNEIADIDSDGWPVFVDGWGKPIMFLRWAPGFSSGGTMNPNPFNVKDPTQPRADLSDIQTGDPINEHDPFDSRKFFPNFAPSAAFPGGQRPEFFRLIPLVYSAGLDRKYGLSLGTKEIGATKGWFYGVDFTSLKLEDLDRLYEASDISKPNELVGSPADEDGVSNTHLDNITNHRIEQQ
jgi:prepilin-type N-terminal cleavage/methylation domain-containing protein